MVIGITGNMEPGAGIDQSWVPTLKYIGGINEPTSQSMQSISWKPYQTPQNYKPNTQKQNWKQTQ